jgi:serine O-acetyltransferase
LRAELQGILLYRIAREYYLVGNPVCDTYAALGRWLSGFEIYYSAEVGESFKINHGMGTVIGARSLIGENATFHHGITLGDKSGGRPSLKNNVIVYAGAMILGNITIGNDCVIAANSVCLINVPDGATVAGSPAKIIKE